MSLEYNIYLSPHAVSTDPVFVNNGITVYRNILNDYVNVSNGEWFDEMDNPSRRVSFAVVCAHEATHQAIQNDSRVTRIFPTVSVTKEQIRTNFDTKLTSLFPPAALTALRNKLEAAGVDTEWADANTTVRQLVRRILHHQMLMQRTFGGPARAAFKVLNSLPLTGTVSSLTAGQRQSVAGWMASHGMNTSWITLSTPIRQVLRYIHERIATEGLHFGGIGGT